MAALGDPQITKPDVCDMLSLVFGSIAHKDLNLTEVVTASPVRRQSDGVLPILLTISFCHFLNDSMQSLLPAIYPILKTSFGLNFAKIGLLSMSYQITASLLQPLIGWLTDRRPKPWALPIGMASTGLGLLLLATATNFPLLLTAGMMMGLGSAIFHPESSRVARLTSGGRHGFAQSIFQLGGNVGSALGPLSAAYIILPAGRESIGWFGFVALLAIGLLTIVARWYGSFAVDHRRRSSAKTAVAALPRRQVAISLTILLVLIFSKFFYMASLGNFLTFYLIDKFALSIHDAQLYLFLFLASVAAGTFAGGPLGDRFGRKVVIWFSILGVLPFSLALPHATLFWTGVLIVPIGVILSSAFAAIVVYGQELVPGRVGMISGLFFGLAFGMAGLGAASLGWMADITSIRTVYHLCAYLPALGIFAAWLPNLRVKA